MIQELQVMNIQMRIITEENVDQLLNLSYQSQNIDRLLGIDHSDDGLAQRNIKEIIDNYKAQMTEKAKMVVPEVAAPKPQPQQVNPADYGNEEAPEYAPKSPEYAPKSPEESPSSSYEGKFIPQSLEGVSPQITNSSENKYVPISPVNSSGNSPVQNENSDSGSGILDKVSNTANNALNTLDTKLGEVGSGITSGVNSALDSLTNMLPSDNGQSGGGHGPFNNGSMNSIFSSLSPEKQNTILQLGGDQQQQVMSQIMNRMSQPQGGGGGGLGQYFGGLPVKDQLTSLQHTYAQKAGEFKKLASTVSAPTITTIRPESMAQQMYQGNLSLFKPEEPAKSKPSTTSDEYIPSADNSSSSSDNSSSSSGGYNVKKITI
jgi:hypothetical protein